MSNTDVQGMPGTARGYEVLGRDTGWQPIETAPKDGADLLVAYRAPWDEEPYIITGGYWHDEWECFVDSANSERLDANPTHWMRLPEPPVPDSLAERPGTDKRGP